MSRATVGHLAMLAFSAVVAGSFPLGARVGEFISPMALNAVRLVLAAIVLGALGAARREITAQAARASWRYLVLGALYSGYFVLMFTGLRTAAPVSTSAVFTLTPVIAAGFGWLLLGQRLTARMALALGLGAGGALWVIFDADPARLAALDVGRGEAIYFFGCVAHALYTPLTRRLNRGEGEIGFVFGIILAGALLLLALGWPALRATDWGGLPPVVWITILYTAVAAGAGSVMLLQVGAVRLPAAKVMAYTYLVPSWVALWEIALGGTAPPALAAPGVALTIVALLLLLREEVPRPEPT